MRNYSDAALAANQAPITALIPNGYGRSVGVSVVAITLVVMLNLLYAELPPYWLGIGKDVRSTRSISKFAATLPPGCQLHF